MKQPKKATFAGRIRRAWRAFLGKPADRLYLGVSVKECKDCDYRYTAEEKAPPSRYFHEITYMDNLVLVVFYEATEHGKVEIARGHGHVIHEGAAGVAQATSYAMRGIWNRLHD